MTGGGNTQETLLHDSPLNRQEKPVISAKQTGIIIMIHKDTVKKKIDE